MSADEFSRGSPGRPKTFLAPTGGGLAPKELAGGSLTSQSMHIPPDVPFPF